MLWGCFSFYCWSCFVCEILVLWHEIELVCRHRTQNTALSSPLEDAICKSSIWGIQLTYCVCHTSDLWLLPVQILDSKSSVSYLRWWDSVERPNRRGSNCQIEGPLIRSRGVRVICCFQYFHLKGTLIWQIWHSICMLMPDLFLCSRMLQRPGRPIWCRIFGNPAAGPFVAKQGGNGLGEKIVAGHLAAGNCWQWASVLSDQGHQKHENT